MSSWFRSGDGKMSVKDLVKFLYPKPSHQLDDRSRFSQLLLEHGEKALQDWAVVAYSSIQDQQNSDMPQSNEVQWEQSPTKNSQRRKPVHHRQQSRTIDKDSIPSANMTKIEGRLHLCSRSLVFEPHDFSRAIVRCPFNRMLASPREYPQESSFGAMCVDFISKKHLVMKQNNVIAAFEPITQLTHFRFTFLHSTPTSFVELCDKLVAMSSSSRHAISPELDALLRPMLDRPFDMDNLVNVREQPLTSHLRCSIMLPLQSKPGVLMITAQRLYFQPAAGVLQTNNESRAISWLLANVVATARRYNGLRDSAIELFWKDQTSTLIALERRHDREQVFRYLPKHAVCVTDRDFVCQVYEAWSQQQLSNYEYLLALNAAAGRSFHDLSRYPVFPWVIADYKSDKLNLDKMETYRDLSKPVGALNESRLEYFQSRMESMKDMEEPFLFGTHYSAPGYVLYYLVRSMPEHMLCLQNGKFDAPDRMFHDILQCYNCVLTNHADVKELIPEFYNDNNDFDFLINARGLHLGATQNGERVDDVKLPPWARSPRDFIKKNRKALESDICTRMLPAWVDLIFGCKSRGDQAMSSNNLFHRMAYLGPTDLAGMQTEEERYQAELQATEFGIVPDLLFDGPHPSRFKKMSEGNHDDFISASIGRASSTKDDSGREAWELLDHPSTSSHDEPQTPVQPPFVDESMVQTDEAYNASRNSQKEALPSMIQHSLSNLSADSQSSGRRFPLRGSGEKLSQNEPRRINTFGSLDSMEHPAISPTLPTPPITPLLGDSTILSSDWDMKVMERKMIHSDSVSGCFLLLDDKSNKQSSMLVTTSLDGGLMVHVVSLGLSAIDEGLGQTLSSTLSRFSYSTIMNRAQLSNPSSSKLTEFRTHTSRDPLACLAIALDGAGGLVVFAGGHDDVILAYGVNSACAVASVYSHRDAVTGLDVITRTPFDAESALWLDGSTHLMVSGSWDATVKVWSATVTTGEGVSISREPIAELFDASSSIVCVSAHAIAGGGIVISAGGADGSFCVWNVHSDGVQVVLHNEPARRGSGPCSVVKWISDSGILRMFAAFSTGKVASYILVDGSLQRKGAVSIGVAILSLVYTSGVLLVGCSDGGLRLIPIGPGGKFDSKPILWPSVNNKSSPGIGSISLAYNGEGRAICCTGGEDGSVALFELKKRVQQ